MTATSYTYDVDTRYKSDVQYIEDDVMKIMFVKSSDILTKTLRWVLQTKHSRNMIGE